MVALLPRLPSVPQGRLVVLNGPSSAGKSSIARALQRELAEPWLHVTLDGFRSMEPPGYFARGHEAEWPLRLASLCRAMHAAVHQQLAHGQNVLLDHVLTDAAWHYLFEDFERDVALIGMNCSVEELDRRERERGDRPVGLARSQAAMHRGREHDLTIDTTHAGPTVCAGSIARWLSERHAPCAFERMRRVWAEGRSA